MATKSPKTRADLWKAVSRLFSEAAQEDPKPHAALSKYADLLMKLLPPDPDPGADTPSSDLEDIRREIYSDP